ncbi:hypothetical protein HYALB_00010298 [Hymenoscyphus albidus]|uniref:NAD(P)-binding protein n=1 Tax=Hymenoscyphus albidus TaxID=595503 RepID=A0A9N9M4V9_9HELO|nr:hypothetical protein HYALB_00010298 [Hymenoscyphus albidus]
MFKPESLPSLSGKVFLVTGGNTGIGYSTVLCLASKGARVYLGARYSTKAQAAITQIKESYPDADVRPLIMDHKSLSTVVEAAKTFLAIEKSLNGLILNAGIMACPFEITSDGFESQMQTNYIAHWVLTHHLLPNLLSTSIQQGPGSARVVNVSSDRHQKTAFGTTQILYDEKELENFGRHGRYGVSKLANVMHSANINSRFGPESESVKQGKGEIWSASLHPGFIDTKMNDLNRDRAPWYLGWLHAVLLFLGIIRPVNEGCISSLFTGASEKFTAEMSGKYFDEKARLKEPNPAPKDQEGLTN